jgi:hypothetical protein
MVAGVSGSLNRRSGFLVASEAKKYGRVRHGGVVVTPAGKLNAKFVFHAVTIGTATDPSLDVRTLLRPSRDILRQIMSGCFYHATTLASRVSRFHCSAREPVDSRTMSAWTR